ncbi:MAG: hypothetical protein AAGH92_01235 [Planctomycetota bacterium]
MTLARTLTLAATAALGLSICTVAAAQHAGFVLFGESNEAGLAQAAEDKHVHPITSPYFHEDSFVTTDVRAWYLYHDFPKSSAIAGGNATVFAVQLRVALTDQLQFVASKDGYIDFDTGLVDDSGLGDVAASIKWNFLQDWDNQLHAAVGLGYEVGVGDDEVLQDDDEIRIYATIDKGFDKLHLGGTLNLTIPTGSEDALGDSTRLFWHARADYYLCEWFSPVVNLNGYHTIDEGDNTPLPFSGVDVANFGGGQSEDVITAGLGGEFRLIDNLGLRGAYEFPLTDNDDLFGYRWTFSAIYSF